MQGLHWVMLTSGSLEETVSVKNQNDEDDVLTKFSHAYRYFNTYLITPEGWRFYAVRRAVDDQTNFLAGQFRDTNLGLLVKRITKSDGFGFADFEAFAPIQQSSLRGQLVRTIPVDAGQEQVAMDLVPGLPLADSYP